MSGRAESEYRNNAYPLQAKPYMELPLGSIKAAGWLEEMLVRQRDGISASLDKYYPEVLGKRNGWLGGDGDQWERGPYWIDGLLPLAYILDDDSLKHKVQPWIEWALKSQREDGFFGPSVNYEAEKGLQRNNSEDWWPRMVVLKVMKQYYSATGDERVIGFLTNYFHYQLKTLPEYPLGHWTFWAEYRVCDNLQIVYWLYNITKDQSLLDLGKLLHAQGIDPSLFFEGDKVWYCGTVNGDDKTPPRRYDEEDRIYIQELNVSNGEFIGERHIVTSGNAINSPNAEAPHIYKINGKYYLMIAEGGTWENHSVTVFTSDAVTGPYTPFVCNPVLTHRFLGNNIDITTVGHADLVQTQYGDWYSVMLGVRPIDGYNMLGRETFLTPVEFQGDQPIFNPGIGRVLMEDAFPKLPACPVTKPAARDNFDGDALGLDWNFLRTPFEKWYEIKDSKLSIQVRPQRLTELTNPSLIARRVEHSRFEASASMTFTPSSPDEEAGLIIMQNDRFQYRLVVTRKSRKEREVKLIRVKGGAETVVASAPVTAGDVVLEIKGDGIRYSFLYGPSESDMTTLAADVDATVCSTNVAKGFIGPFVGMYASANGNESRDSASFDWFDYQGK